MYESIEDFQPFVLIGAGAILGSWLRVYMTRYSLFFFSASYFGTAIINITSAFILGYFLAIQNQAVTNHQSPFFLFACVGFLGGLSTFSTFITDILNNFLVRKFKTAFFLAFCSILFGLLLSLLGLAFGDA